MNILTKAKGELLAQFERTIMGTITPREPIRGMAIRRMMDRLRKRTDCPKKSALAWNSEWFDDGKSQHIHFLTTYSGDMDRLIAFCNKHLGDSLLKKYDKGEGGRYYNNKHSSCPTNDYDIIF